ncbi:ribonuclease R [Pseudohongiella sp. SYSU M77423]|uniref:ribonuclease R n=1 Tax=Pseudohongiella sp. SYSU M77423 TaxID=3042312 RepID=UPI00247FA931|nr:ribonuclease R [Pseudohongiella sp. SYSU M77423]MDH7942508.1 ribonuclease R [Pseudohongiella sp. SYSU M77423]
MPNPKKPGKQKSSKSSTPPLNHDPFATREAEKYDNPIPSREFILAKMEEIAEPVSYETLCETFNLADDPDQAEALRRRLIAMSRDGQLISNRRGVYGLVDKMELIKGRVQGTKDGMGFFIPNDGSGDLVLPPNEMVKLFDGDIVLARVAGVDRRGRKEGMVVEILERRVTQVVGRFYKDQGFGLVVPDNRRISHEVIIPEKDTRGAQDGQFVVAVIRSYPDKRRKAIGEVTEILGDHMAPGMEIDVALRSHGIPHEWPREVTQAVKDLKEEVAKDDIKGREDLRQLPFVTIDGEDAKDFDDAVYCEPGPRGTAKLYVAIADVSHYVKPDSALDEEAQNRGNSVYFPGHVVPMLPEVLSNGLCSLKPKVDRLVMVCEMEIGRTGKVNNYTFFEGVIHSHARLTYTEVADMLEEPDSDLRERSQTRLRSKYADLVPHLEALYGIYHKLSEARQKAGALDFSSTETRIVFGETRKIREIVPVVRNSAHRLIEECMLAANVCTAKFLAESGLPVLYRVHEGPNNDKLENLKLFLRELGLVLTRSDKPTPQDYQRVLQAIEGRSDANLIQTMLIRSMMQAVYQPDNIGHFGLGFESYAHFTSPIRRYPDLLVHRALRYLIRSGKQWAFIRRIKDAVKLNKRDIYPYQEKDMVHFGELCSMTERRADAASYDVLDWLKCEYVQDRVGDEFDGTVSSVTGFGLFVQLSDIYVEGLVHITALQNDYYQFDPVRQLLRGERSGVTYHLGDTVRVRVVRVDLDERKIDLQVVDGSHVGKPGGPGKGARTGSGKDGKSAKGGRGNSSGGKGRGGKTQADAGAGAGAARRGGRSGDKSASKTAGKSKSTGSRSAKSGAAKGAGAAKTAAKPAGKSRRR